MRTSASARETTVRARSDALLAELVGHRTVTCQCAGTLLGQVSQHALSSCSGVHWRRGHSSRSPACQADLGLDWKAGDSRFPMPGELRFRSVSDYIELDAHRHPGLTTRLPLSIRRASIGK